jgi:periplasmic divalent cation tolerance protein
VADYIITFVTTSSKEEAEKIANALIEEKLAACCNIIERINSLFFWQGKKCSEQEILIIIKTKTTLFEKLSERVISLHSYEVPEIIALPIVSGNKKYLDWINESTL